MNASVASLLGSEIPLTLFARFLVREHLRRYANDDVSESNELLNRSLELTLSLLLLAWPPTY